MNRLKAVQELGQSIWLDFIRRDLLTGGKLRQMVAEGIRGMTSNPTIFQQAIAGSTEYDADITAILKAEPGIATQDLYERLAVEDIRMTADILRPVYAQSGKVDGMVSLEVSPRLADDAEGTLAEARRLWRLVDRPNLMIKVPATPAGIRAGAPLIAEGINVNFTLMFSLGHYDAVAHAYLGGLEKTPRPAEVTSVASFFVSRVDTYVDRALEKIGTPAALALRGRAAIANTRLAYRRFREIFDGAEFAALKKRGARVQRPLWGSTSTKNPAYSDVLYLENLIGPDTVNTVPPDALEAFLDHGKARPTLEEGGEETEKVLAELGKLGVDLDAITEQLQVDGVKAFADSFEKLLAALEEKRHAG
ncbi:MAG: transaldolase [Chloroflexota bacterium]